MKETALQYVHLTSRQQRTILAMAVFLAVVAGASLCVGPIRISLGDLWGESDTAARQILMAIRLPRILAAIMAGAGLSLSGLAMQNVLRNPLASPFTLGVSGAAAFGAAFSIVILGVPRWLAVSHIPAWRYAAPFLTGLSAFGFSILSVLIILLAMKQRGSRPSVIVLTGMMTSSLFSAGTSALQYFANDRQLAEIVFWTFGDPGRAGYPLLILQALVLLPVLFWMNRHRWDFALLQSGDDSAKAGGLNPSRFRFKVLIFTSLVTAVMVAGYGIISFVGLVSPHLSRLFVRGQSLSLASSALFGAIFLLVSDTLARSLLSPVILPVGIVTAFFGAPFFIAMLIRNREL